MGGHECLFDDHMISTIREAVKSIAETINFANHATFSLYETKPFEATENGELVNRQKHLEGDLCIADIISQKEDKEETYLLLKKHMFG